MTASVSLAPECHPLSRSSGVISKVKSRWKYLYQAVDSEGNTLDFLLSSERVAKAEKRFLRKLLKASHMVEPRVITVDKSPSYPAAMSNLKEDKDLAEATNLRQSKYMNNVVQQDRRNIKRRVNPGLGLAFFNTARGE